MTDETLVQVPVWELKALLKIFEAAKLTIKAEDSLDELIVALADLRQAVYVLKLDSTLQELTRSGHDKDTGNGGS